MRTRALLLALALAFSLTELAGAQTIVYETYRPVVAAQYVAPAPVYSYRPIAGSTFTNYYPNYAPPAVTAYSPVVTSYSPVVTSYSPVVTSYSPVVTETPVVTYSPVVTESPVVTYSPVVTAYSPVVTSAYAPVATYSYYTPAVVRSKVLYVPGQPIRNFFRGITP